MSTSCKVCEIYKDMPIHYATEINAMILERTVSADRAAQLFTNFKSQVGASTVKKHRNENHVVV